MKNMVGLSAQEVAVEYGAPSNVLDLPDGRRVFQFDQRRVGYMPASTTTQGSVWANTWSATSVTTGGYPVELGCIFTFYTSWNEQRSAWIVTDYKVPGKLIC